MNTAISNPQRFWAYLQLMRPANIITAWADVLAGFAASGCIILVNQQENWSIQPANLLSLLWLLLSTTGLYGGGIVFNDVFDAELDAQERPERPIPSGRASRSGATILGILLFSMGVLAALQVSWLSGTLAGTIAFTAIVYNAYGKHHPIFGPLSIGLCRGGNLLLGVSAVSAMVAEDWFLALIPVVYIAAITVLSRDEVKVGDGSTSGIIALLLIGAVLTGLFGLGLLENYHLLAVIPFIILLAVRVLLPIIKTVRQPTPENFRLAVRAGILSLIIVDATVATSFAGLPYGLLVLSLLPISMALAQVFAVT
jgi:4-hydroxybenzoate polyprenyltransferase